MNIASAKTLTAGLITTCWVSSNINNGNCNLSCLFAEHVGLELESKSYIHGFHFKNGVRPERMATPAEQTVINIVFLDFTTLNFIQFFLCSLQVSAWTLSRPVPLALKHMRYVQCLEETFTRHMLKNHRETSLSRTKNSSGKRLCASRFCAVLCSALVVVAPHSRWNIV